MRISWRVAVLVGLAAWLCSKAYAAIYGPYPGLRSLIDQSDVIAAVAILKELPETYYGGYALYKVEFDKVLKGNPPKKQTVVLLRKLEIDSERLSSSAVHHKGSRPQYITSLPPEIVEPFQPSSRHVVFLTKTKGDKDAAYENVQCEGSSFPISPLRDLGSLKVDSLPDTLILLFREYVDFKRSELKDLQQQLDAFTHQSEK